ncbi:MAG: D-glycero-beta-D-manno-heptose 1-phosphate adenylyltransferase [Anaerolineales bacterium]
MNSTNDLLNTINNFNGRRVLVIGEGMLDSYLQGTSERLCQEAPVPIVDVHAVAYMPGGAANTAVNLSALGADVTFLSVLGDDELGDRLIDSLEKQRVSTDYVWQTSRRNTLAKQRIFSNSQMVVRFDEGSAHPLDKASETEMIERLRHLFPQHEAIVVSDYNHGVLTPRVIVALEELQRNDPRILVIDLKQLQAYQTLNMTVAKLNYEECVQLLDVKKLLNDDERVQQISDHGKNVLGLTNAEMTAVTLAQSGALIFHRDDQTPYRTYAEAKPDSQVAGAGDTFVSALTLSFAAGADMEHAAEIASAAASVVVAKNGTAVCNVDELKEHLSTTEKFLTDFFQLTLRLASYRRSGRTIVFTNGCFDILHRGHIAYLNRAKALGDILIVGMNSDQSVRRLKGAERPINSLEDRAQILAALSCVDHIIPFDDDTPHALISYIKPDIFVKGGDYTRETLPEAELVEELGGQVYILPYLENYSTTSVIEKIRESLVRNMVKENG